MNAGKAVYGILSTNAEVTAIVGTKIFPEVAEQETALPLIVYQLQSVAPEDTHDGPSKLDEVRFEVDLERVVDCIIADVPPRAHLRDIAWPGGEGDGPSVAPRPAIISGRRVRVAGHVECAPDRLALAVFGVVQQGLQVIGADVLPNDGAVVFEGGAHELVRVCGGQLEIPVDERPVPKQMPLNFGIFR